MRPAGWMHRISSINSRHESMPMNWNDFFSMDGRAIFIWGSFGAVALAIAVEIILLRLRIKRIKRVQQQLNNSHQQVL